MLAPGRGWEGPAVALPLAATVLSGRSAPKPSYQAGARGKQGAGRCPTALLSRPTQPDWGEQAQIMRAVQTRRARCAPKPHPFTWRSTAWHAHLNPQPQHSRSTALHGAPSATLRVVFRMKAAASARLTPTLPLRGSCSSPGS
jgi:hypothetical protein